MSNNIENKDLAIKKKGYKRGMLAEIENLIHVLKACTCLDAL